MADRTVFDRVVAESVAAKWRPKTRLDRRREEEIRRTAIPKRAPGETYLGHVPMRWKKLADDAGALYLGEVLWFIAVVRKTNGTIRFNACEEEEEEFGIPPSTAARQLHALQKARLIKLDNHNGNRAGWVTLLAAPKEK